MKHEQLLPDALFHQLDLELEAKWEQEQQEERERLLCLQDARDRRRTVYGAWFGGGGIATLFGYLALKQGAILLAVVRWTVMAARVLM